MGLDKKKNSDIKLQMEPIRLNTLYSFTLMCAITCVDLKKIVQICSSISLTLETMNFTKTMVSRLRHTPDICVRTNMTYMYDRMKFTTRVHQYRYPFV